MNFEQLKARHPAERGPWHPNLSLRVHRALSWLHRAEQLAGLDAGKKRFDGLVWQEFPRSIRVLLDNQYVFADFWRFQNGSMTEDAWKANFAVANRAAGD